jgi:ankyrin repeat protein
MVKAFRIAILTAAAFAAFAAPAVAQLGPGYESLEFIDAVKKSDGDKATQLLNAKPASTLVNARDGDGNTALIIAVARKDPDWTGFLLNKGADPNLGGKGGDTPLIVASRFGFEEAVEWLLSLGAKVDGTNKMGETPLIAAVQQRQTPVVRLLLNAGANPDKTDTAAGYSARDYAQRDGRSREILQLIQSKKPKPTAAH